MVSVSSSKRKFIASTANNDFVLQSAKGLIESVYCHFPIVEPVLEGPLERLRTAAVPDDSMRAAVSSWKEAKQGKYIKLNESSGVVPMASFFVITGVPAQNFYICVAMKKEIDQEEAELILEGTDVVEALSVFENLAGTSLQVNRVDPAKGRPTLYLMLSRNRIVQGKVPSSAESRTNRIHALMLALAIWIELLKTRE